jgi:hypothetical protein
LYSSYIIWMDKWSYDGCHKEYRKAHKFRSLVKNSWKENTWETKL